MLEICHIQKSFRNNHVLRDVSFAIRQGEIVALLGNNGAGKTTIINCILKMMKPDGGSILLSGKEVYKISNKAYFSDVSALLESSINIYDYLTGRQNIAYFSGLSKVSPERLEQIWKYVERFGLTAHMDKLAGEYSRGMQQKLAIVIALLPSPKLLLLDEPTLGLDIKSKLAVIELLQTIAKEERIAVLLTTHQMDVVEKLGSRILLLKDGFIREFSPVSKDRDSYIVTYLKDGTATDETVRAKFDEIYQKYHEYEILEIKYSEPDLETCIMEALDEPSQS